MSRIDQITSVLKEHRSRLFGKYHLTELGVFGSTSRGDAKEASDIDILIDYEGAMGLEFVDLAEELEELLSTKVDLVSKRAIKPNLLSRIKSDLVYV